MRGARRRFARTIAAVPPSTDLPFSAASPDAAPASDLLPTEVTPHAVSRLRSARLARSTRPFLARGGPKGERCEGCRLRPSHCICALRPDLPTDAGFCLLMHDAEPLKPSNTGWLIADVVQRTWAFGWSRTEIDPALQALLADPQWQPYVVFPSEYVQPPERAVHTVQPTASAMDLHSKNEVACAAAAKKPLFILLDATWPEARKMFRKSPYLDGFPVLGLQPEQISRYRLRRSKRDDHFCTSEVAALCLELTGHPQDQRAGQALEAYLEVYTHHYLQAKHQRPPDLASAAHQQLGQAVHGAVASAAGMHLRAAQAGDQAALAALYLQVRCATMTWVEPAQFALADFAAHSAGEAVQVAVDDGGAVIGFSAVWEASDFLHMLYIHPAWQGRGVGRALLQALPGWPLRPYRLKCLVRNPRALAFYHAQGFVRVGGGSSPEGDFDELELRAGA